MTNKLNTKEKVNIRFQLAENILANHSDKGRKGKVFELLVRNAITPNSKELGVRKKGEYDINFKYNGKMLYCEVKSESGEIATFTGEDAKMDKRDITLEHLIKYQKAKYIIYSIDGSLEQARLIKTVEFMKLVLEYQTKRAPNGLINWINSKERMETLQGRLKVTVNKGQGQGPRREWLASNIQTIGIPLSDVIIDRMEKGII